jgi:nitroreductase
MLGSLKSLIKRTIAGIESAARKSPALDARYQEFKIQAKRTWVLRFFLYDISNTYRAMFWPSQSLTYRTLAASLLFQYHKLEKGLAMPGPRRLFGIEPAVAVIDYLERWHRARHPVTDPVYLGALETLHAYRDRLVEEDLDQDGAVLPRVHDFLQVHGTRTPELATPQPLAPALDPARAYSDLQALALRRRSVRSFKPDPVPEEVLRKAAAVAQLAPSVCNRQTCQVVVISEPELKRKALAYQNGNRGFGHLAPLVLLITADESDFFDASERHQPYIDGGLFTMGFILALESQGVSSCCLNWCATPRNDKAVHRVLGIPANVRIVTMMVVGYAAADCVVPRSPRRAGTSVLRYLDHGETVDAAATPEQLRGSAPPGRS